MARLVDLAQHRLAPRRAALPWLVAVALTACADGHHDDADHHHIPPEVEAAARYEVIPLALGNADYGPANWVASPNYVTANRGKGQIKKVIVHTVQGSYAGCISWFQNPSSNVSAHFVVSKNGEVTQMVKEKDIGWHVGSENGYTVGIEHEGWVSDPAYVTPAMRSASAALTCYLLKKYGLPADRVSVMGHVELPKQTHTDPGKHWPWDAYMADIEACMGGTTPPTCPGSCDDGNPCTNDGCVSGACSNAAANGIVCWDGDACTAGEKCSNGKCVGGSIVKDCDDNNACTDDACAAGNCTHSPNSAGCDDGNACTSGDKCGGGKCAPGAVKGCDDGDPCTSDSCSGGACKHSPAAAGCDDGDPCTVGDGCDPASGGCKAGEAKDCDDGDPCTVGDACQPSSGKCVEGTAKACDDGDPCTIGDGCHPATGACLGGAKKDCGSDGDDCTVGACDAASGACQKAKDGAGCDDGNPCSQAEICQGGSCVVVSMMACEDANPCTHDSCSGGVCQHAPHSQFCDDGDGCTVGDVCSGGACKGAPLACDDGDPCTSEAPCQLGACKAGTPLCDDGNDCTSDACDGGSCSHVDLEVGACEDDDACTVGDRCKQGTCVGGAQRTCSDGDPCTNDRCLSDKGCAHDAKPGCTAADGGASVDGLTTSGDGFAGAGASGLAPSAPSAGCSAAPAARAGTAAAGGVDESGVGWLLAGAIAAIWAGRRRAAREARA